MAVSFFTKAGGASLILTALFLLTATGCTFDRDVWYGDGDLASLEEKSAAYPDLAAISFRSRRVMTKKARRALAEELDKESRSASRRKK